jgi:hypothetical protein
MSFFKRHKEEDDRLLDYLESEGEITVDPLLESYRLDLISRLRKRR